MLFGIVTRSYTKMKCTKHGISQQNKFLGKKYKKYLSLYRAKKTGNISK